LYGCEEKITESEYPNFRIIETAEIFMADKHGNILGKICDGREPLFIPNTNKILYRYYNQLFIINTDGSDKKLIALLRIDDKNSRYVGSVSFDGRYVVYSEHTVNYVCDIFIAALDGSYIQNLTNSPGILESIIGFSPINYDFIFHEAFYKSSNEHKITSRGISIMDIHGNNYYKLYHDSISSAGANYSTDGKYIFGIGSINNEQATISIIDVLTRRIVKTIVLEERRIRYGPVMTNDNKIYYSPDDNDLYLIDVDTEVKTKIFSGLVGIIKTFSHDYKKVLSTANFGDKLYLTNLDNGAVRTVISKKEYSFFDCSFSPDDNYFLFVKYFYKEER
jgi:Tol biopolymer transport system component